MMKLHLVHFKIITAKFMIVLNSRIHYFCPREKNIPSVYHRIYHRSNLKNDYIHFMSTYPLFISVFVKKHIWKRLLPNCLLWERRGSLALNLRVEGSNPSPTLTSISKALICICCLHPCVNRLITIQGPREVRYDADEDPFSQMILYDIPF